MRTDMKIGVIIGVVVVLALTVMLVNRTDQTGIPEPEITVPQTATVTEPIEITAEPTAEPPQEPVMQVKKPSPAPSSDLIPAVKEFTKSASPVVVETEIRPERYHTVVKGDSLSEIAEIYYGQGKHWKIIYRANRNLIQNPDYLGIGWKLRIPYPNEVTETAD